jgi:hypothetical protein
MSSPLAAYLQAPSAATLSALPLAPPPPGSAADAAPATLRAAPAALLAFAQAHPLLAPRALQALKIVGPAESVWSVMGSEEVSPCGEPGMWGVRGTGQRGAAGLRHLCCVCGLRSSVRRSCSPAAAPDPLAAAGISSAGTSRTCVRQCRRERQQQQHKLLRRRVHRLRASIHQAARLVARREQQRRHALLVAAHYAAGAAR